MSGGQTERKLRILQEEIQHLPGAKSIRGHKAFVCCPFHADTNPSATISLDTSEREVPLGFFGCFVCKKNMGWNAFATHMNLKPFKKPENLDASDFSDPSALRDSFLGTALQSKEDPESKFPDLKDLEFLDEFPFDKWRDVDTQLLHKIGARLVKHKEYGRHWIWLPVNVRKRLRGYVRATLDKAPAGKSSYLNAKGSWSKKWGLLYFDYAIRLMKKKGLKTLILCEGPRDSLRYLARGMPAVSVLGALNWGPDKRMLLEQAGVEKLILSFDGDKAGYVAARHIYHDVKIHFKTQYLALWKLSPAWKYQGCKTFPTNRVLKRLKRQGKLKGEVDPFSCPERYIDLVEENLE